MFFLLIFSVLFQSISSTMTCENAYEMRSIFNVVSGWQVRCCPGGYVNPAPDVECIGPGVGFTATCSIIFPELSTGENCECGDLCTGTVIQLNSDCSGTCTCGGICCADGAPCNTSAPTSAPTTKAPTKAPTTAPTKAPTAAPTSAPTTKAPTKAPTTAPTTAPTKAPTEAPTQAPVGTPTSEPTEAPTEAPTSSPTSSPTGIPTSAPTTPGNTGMGLAMGLIFGPLGAMILVGAIYLLYQSSYSSTPVKYSRT